MPYYQSSFPSKAKDSGNGLLRVLGALLSLGGMILAAVSIFFYQSIPGLVISAIVGLFGLRVFMLWLRARVPMESAFKKPGFERIPIGPNVSLSPRAGASSAPVVHSVRTSPASSLSHVPITAYPSQPAYAAQTSYAQAQQPPMFEERHS